MYHYNILNNVISYFVKITEFQSINQAAKFLDITQPSLSTALKKLENELGIILFERSNRGLKLTSKGNDFYKYVKKIEDENKLFLKSFNQLSSQLEIKIGASEFYVPKVVAFINQNKSRQVKFKMFQRPLQEIKRAVEDGVLDFGIIELPHDPIGEFNFKKIEDCKIAVYGRKDKFPLLQKVKRRSELITYPFAMTLSPLEHWSEADHCDNNYFLFTSENRVISEILKGNVIGETDSRYFSKKELSTLASPKLKSRFPQAASYFIYGKSVTHEKKEIIQGLFDIC